MTPRPDHLAGPEFDDARPISLAELVRRGLEHMLRLYPLDQKPGEAWTPPEAQALGELRAPVRDWRELANLPPDPPEATS